MHSVMMIVMLRNGSVFSFLFFFCTTLVYRQPKKGLPSNGSINYIACFRLFCVAWAVVPFSLLQ